MDISLLSAFLICISWYILQYKIHTKKVFITLLLISNLAEVFPQLLTEAQALTGILHWFKILFHFSDV